MDGQLSSWENVTLDLGWNKQIVYAYDLVFFVTVSQSLLNFEMLISQNMLSRPGSQEGQECGEHTWLDLMKT